MASVMCEDCGARAVRRISDAGQPFQRWLCEQCRRQKYGCPRCAQGWLRRGAIVMTGDELYICEECDATWTPGQLAAGDAGAFVDFTIRMERLGGRGLWSELRFDI